MFQIGLCGLFSHDESGLAERKAHDNTQQRSEQLLVEV